MTEQEEEERHWILQQFETIAWQNAKSILSELGIESTDKDYGSKLYDLEYTIYHKLKELKGVD